MAETALLINPSRRRRSSRRRRARRNPTQLTRALANLQRGKRRRGGRRRYRRNPGFFFGGHFTLAHAGGAGAYGVLKNGVRRLYWMGKDQPAEQAAAVAKFNKHSAFVKAGIVAAGWALRAATKGGKWAEVGEGIMLAGIADGIESITENLGLTPVEKSEKEARKKAEQALDGAGMLVNRGGLASVLVERERQLRGGDDELDELDPSDAFDEVDDDDFEADEDELY
jgi:hypothetical protein